MPHQQLDHIQQAIVVNGMVYTSGQVPLDEHGRVVADDIVNQTHQVLKNLFYVVGKLVVLHLKM